MSTFNLIVSTPYTDIFRGEALSLSCTDLCGEVTILAQHENAIKVTEPSKLSIINAKNETIEFFTSGGILEVRDGKVIYCIDTAETKEEIDIKRAQDSIEKHKEKDKTDKGDYSQIDDMLKELSLKRAVGRIEFAKNKK